MLGYNEPLGLPRGSVRAIATILSLLAALASWLVANPGASARDVLSMLASLLIGHYFGHRTAVENAVPRSETEPVVTGGFTPAVDASQDEGEPDQVVPGSQA